MFPTEGGCESRTCLNTKKVLEYFLAAFGKKLPVGGGILWLAKISWLEPR